MKGQERGELSMIKRIRRYSCIGYSRDIFAIKLIGLSSGMN